ncbi:MAG: acyl-CoA dehydrogenase family protein [Bacillota bacterium]
MDFRLTEDQEAIRKAVRDLAQRRIAPRAARYDETGEFPWDNVRDMSEMGLMGLTIAEEYGGAGQDMVSQSICIEELSRACSSTGVIFETHLHLCASTIQTWGNEDQKKRYLPLLASGERLGALGVTEPDAGSDAGSIATRAERTPSGYVLNGQKRFITNAREASIYVIIASTDPEKKARGLSAFIVNKDQPGVSFGEPEDKMGIRASVASDILLENVEVPRENLLAREGEGFKVAMTTLNGGRIGIAAQAVGIGQHALERALTYSLQRHQFDRPISDFQAIQWMLAETATEIEAARLLYLRAASLVDQGLSYAKEAAMAKLFASEAAERATSRAVQIHGGYGYMKEYHVERLMRDSKITQIYEGTSEVMKMVISGALLKEAKTNLGGR